MLFKMQPLGPGCFYFMPIDDDDDDLFVSACLLDTSMNLQKQINQ